MLQLNHVTVTRGEREVLSDCTFQFQEGKAKKDTRAALRLAPVYATNLTWSSLASLFQMKILLCKFINEQKKIKL